MKIKSKFWPLFVEATFGTKPNRLFWYYVACVTALIIIPLSWITVVSNWFGMRKDGWKDRITKPFTLLMSFMLPIICMIGAKMWLLVFGEFPKFDSIFGKLLFIWSMGFPGLIGTTVIIFLAAVAAVFVIWPISALVELITDKLRFGSPVYYEVDDIRRPSRNNNGFGGCGSEDGVEELTSEDELTD